MSTYFLVTTVDTQDAIAIARDMDEPTDVPTIEQLRNRIRGELSLLISAVVDACSEGSPYEDDLNDIEIEGARNIVKIVTLGNVED